MGHVGWGAIWKLALSRYGSEGIETRILIGLAVAFAMLMMIEGLRASFLPSRTNAPAGGPAAGTAGRGAPSGPFCPRAVAAAPLPKRGKPRVAGPKIPERGLRPPVRRSSPVER